MTSEHAIESIIKEMSAQGIFPMIFKNILRRYLYMTYCIGYDAGTRIRSNEKPVVQYSKEGNFIERFDSAVHAARRIEGYATNITKDCKSKKHTYKGFMWHYEKTG
jgi:hypothetical protein